MKRIFYNVIGIKMPTQFSKTGVSWSGQIVNSWDEYSKDLYISDKQGNQPDETVTPKSCVCSITDLMVRGCPFDKTGVCNSENKGGG
jgi:hypothetical protein